MVARRHNDEMNEQQHKVKQTMTNPDGKTMWRHVVDQTKTSKTTTNPKPRART